MKKSLPVETVDRLLKSLLLASRAIEHVLQVQAVEAATGERLSPSKVQILRLLGHRGAQTGSRIARFLDVTKPAVSQIADAMVKARLVSRKPARHDRREVKIGLTKLGREKFRAIQRAQRHILRVAVRSVEGLDPEQWIHTFTEIAGAVSEADRAYRTFCLQCSAHDDDTCVVPDEDESCPFLNSRSRDVRPSSRSRSKR